MGIRWGDHMKGVDTLNISRVSDGDWSRTRRKPKLTICITSVLWGLGLIHLGLKHCQTRHIVMLCHLRLEAWTQISIFADFQREVIIPFPSRSQGWCFRGMRGRDYTQRNNSCKIVLSPCLSLRNKSAESKHTSTIPLVLASDWQWNCLTANFPDTLSALLLNASFRKLPGGRKWDCTQHFHEVSTLSFRGLSNTLKPRKSTFLMTEN